MLKLLQMSEPTVSTESVHQNGLWCEIAAPGSAR
jgi:hypothetical protein